MSDFNGVRINDELIDPTGDYVKNYMFYLQKETAFLDYKKKINIEKNSDFPKFVKDVFAFANYGGGFVFLGIEENPHLDPDVKSKFLPTGLSSDFHIDQATLQEKINSYSNTTLRIDYDEFYKTVEDENRKFAIIYIHPSTEIAKPTKDGEYADEEGTKRSAFKKDTIFVRRITQSIPASALEVEWIKNRIIEENYRISVLSGEPDKVTEILFANLFEVKKLPSKLFIGTPKFFNSEEVFDELKKHMRYPIDRIRYYENKIVTFQNLTDKNNPYSNLVVDPTSVYHESTSVWLSGFDKRNIAVSLLNKEIIGKGIDQGMRFHKKTSKLFFPSDNQKRQMSWPSKFRAARRTVANPLYASQLKSKVFIHPAIKVSFEDISSKFFLQLNPTFVITIDGKQVLSGLREGTIITKLSYNKYNDSHLNNVLFWINKLGNGEDVVILEDFIVSSEPINISVDHGISWDIPTTELKSMIENYKPEIEDDVVEEEQNDEFIV
ncbi:MAG: ATP-binding protein [Nitrososphaeria archaeon]|nr:ATP-binding protein [Nitrososphaeria archaeon]NDB52138.1 ATP-binding protein [Nitrosopumilaceae archaeon]NDF24926.1 ATP-binding protein [Nitrososphaerota archaeon]NDB47180.1 ATP-binding protein [Nitrososphaeria archaeon]NDB92740.1 ATP-binding protein [Nitrososphaeria archaeon]